jgi:hypothetical protein
MKCFFKILEQKDFEIEKNEIQTFLHASSNAFFTALVSHLFTLIGFSTGSFAVA